MKAIAERAEKYMQCDPPLIKFSSIHAFVTTGDRDEHAKAYNNYENRICTFSAMYMAIRHIKYLPDKAEFTDSYEFTEKPESVIERFVSLHKPEIGDGF